VTITAVAKLPENLDVWLLSDTSIEVKEIQTNASVAGLP
jgi:hypothetical protein